MKEPPKDEYVVVAGYEDYRKCAGSKIVLLNHGVGQTYLLPHGVKHVSYSGGRNRERCVLFIEPNEHAAALSRESYPDIPAVVVGCPKMDRYHCREFPKHDPPVIAWSHHADIHVCSETRWSLPFYEAAIKRLVSSDLPYKFIGHAHPRFANFMRVFWSKLDVDWVPHFDDVLERADLFVCDNSSALFEYASTDRPVLVLNCPWYRRNVEHGLRFWSAIPGLQVDQPEDLERGIGRALWDDVSLQNIRHKAVQVAYSYTDGYATERAVKALIDLAEGRL